MANSLDYVRKITERGLDNNSTRKRLNISIDIRHADGTIYVLNAPMNAKQGDRNIGNRVGAIRFIMQLIEEHFDQFDRKARNSRESQVIADALWPSAED